MRKDIINIVNKLAAAGSLDFDLMTTHNVIFNYCKENKTRPQSNKYELKNGALFINDKFIKRVDRLPARVAFSEVAYYYEGLILARNENE